MTKTDQSTAVVLFVMCLMYMITYLARVVISAAAPAIMKELHLTKVQMGIAFTAFVARMPCFNSPPACWGISSGLGRFSGIIVFLWSIFTGVTALAWNFVSLVVIRFFFGICEAGAFPNATRAFSRWMPTTERAFASGITHAFGTDRQRAYSGDCGRNYGALGMAMRRLWSSPSSGFSGRFSGFSGIGTRRGV